jgi:murein DD-endopeptidase MepM/ murein hydrolase activator NlpD
VLGLLVAAALGLASVEVQPGVASPGDAVLVVVRGADASPTGTLGTRELTFLPYGDTFLALTAMLVEQPEGDLPLSVTLLEGGEKKRIDGTLTVMPAHFPHRELTVSKKFTSPSKKEQAWGAKDAKAFQEALDVDYEPLKFSDGFSWPRPPDVTAPFGDLRLINGKKSSQHFGTDIDGQTGDELWAAADGEVVMVRECFASGNTVLIHHGARLFTSYFHMSAFEVKEGQAVHRGQHLGHVGKTGRVTGPHLHWGAKIDGHWVDPTTLLRLQWPDP